MITDLYSTKEEQLLEWCKTQGTFSKADVMTYGLNNFYIRADRTIRDFVRHGFLKHLSTEECKVRGLTGNMAYYETT